jgi:hypothetical protein
MKRILAKDVLGGAICPLEEIGEVFHADPGGHQEMNRMISSKVNPAYVSEVIHSSHEGRNLDATSMEHQAMPSRKATYETTGE